MDGHGVVEVALGGSHANGHRESLQDFIRAELAGGRGKTVLLATQDMDEAERMCDDLALLHRGRLLYLGTLAGLLELGRRELGEGSGLGDIFVELVRRVDAARGGGAA